MEWQIFNKAIADYWIALEILGRLPREIFLCKHKLDSKSTEENAAREALNKLHDLALALHDHLDFMTKSFDFGELLEEEQSDRPEPEANT